MCTGNRKGTLFGIVINLKKIIVAYNSFQKITALQAHGKCKQFIFRPFKKIIDCLRRVSFRLPVRVNASVSIEASIAIPVFLFCFLEIVSLLNYLSVYSGVLYALKTVGEPVSIYGYAYEMLTDSDTEISLGGEVISSLIFSEVYLDNAIQKQCDSPLYENMIKGGVQGISLLGSHINTRESRISIIAHYSVEPLFAFAGTELSMTNRYYAKLWTGYPLGESTVSEEYVYITENGTVYHLTESCTYLRLSISNVRESDLEYLRNESGSKYSACPMCCQDKEQFDVYYITDTGERYHTTVSCSGLKRTVYCVDKKEVEGRPVCSRCNQKKGDS